MPNLKQEIASLQQSIARHWPGLREQIAREWQGYQHMYHQWKARQSKPSEGASKGESIVEADAPESPQVMDKKHLLNNLFNIPKALSSQASDSGRNVQHNQETVHPAPSAVAMGQLPLDVWISVLLIVGFAGLMLMAAYIATLQPEVVANGLKQLNPDLKKQSVQQLFPENMRYTASAVLGGFGALALLVVYGLLRANYKAWVWAIYLMALSMCLLVTVPVAVLVLGSLLKEKVVRLYARAIITA